MGALGDGGVIGGSHSLYGQTTFKTGPDIPKLDIRRIADLKGPSVFSAGA
jgi:hypothetical protein